jgi:hypothetical protein
MSEDNIDNVLNQYKLAADAHADAINALQQGFSAFDLRDYELASELFGNAEEFSQNADFRAILPDIMGEQSATLLVEEALETSNDLETVASDCNTSCSSLSVDGDQPDQKETVENARHRTSQNDFVIPDRQELEDVFDS